MCWWQEQAAGRSWCESALAGFVRIARELIPAQTTGGEKTVEAESATSGAGYTALGHKLRLFILREAQFVTVGIISNEFLTPSNPFEDIIPFVVI